MLVEEVVGDWDHFGVEVLPAVALVAADQEDRGALRVERKQDASRAWAQLLHVRVAGGRHGVDERPAEAGAALLEQVDRVLDRFLFLDGQAVPPLHELVCDLDVPHPNVIAPRTYGVKDISASAHAARPAPEHDGHASGRWA